MYSHNGYDCCNLEAVCLSACSIRCSWRDAASFLLFNFCDRNESRWRRIRSSSFHFALSLYFLPVACYSHRLFVRPRVPPLDLHVVSDAAPRLVSIHIHTGNNHFDFFYIRLFLTSSHRNGDEIGHRKRETAGACQWAVCIEWLHDRLSMALESNVVTHRLL